MPQQVVITLVIIVNLCYQYRALTLKWAPWSTCPVQCSTMKEGLSGGEMYLENIVYISPPRDNNNAPKYNKGSEKSCNLYIEYHRIF